MLEAKLKLGKELEGMPEALHPFHQFGCHALVPNTCISFLNPASSIEQTDVQAEKLHCTQMRGARSDGVDGCCAANRGA